VKTGGLTPRRSPGFESGMPDQGEDYLERSALAAVQGDRLRTLLAEILPRNRFYARKLRDARVAPADRRSPADLRRLPFTTKAELLADQEAEPPYGTNLTYPLERYRRLHQTSGTSERPLRWLDTAESWQWALDCWRQIYRITGVSAADRLCFPFSFGPFLGFWTAFEAADRLGCLCLPAGGMSSSARLGFLLENAATVVLCTPTYALHLAEVARVQGINLAAAPVRALIVAGEPGGSIPATRARIEAAWGARVFDHSGLTEVGPMTIECPEAPGGLHVLEADYVVELIDPQSGQAVDNGQVGEMVVTNLGRWGSPLLRYRTGDLARRAIGPCACGRTFLRLEGGILGRTDGLLHVRGNNVYPSALEAVIHRFPEVAEYRVAVDHSEALAALRIEVEPHAAADGPGLAERIGQAIRDQLLFRAEVTAVAPGSLPRFDMKARRINHRDTETQRRG
jgi:phenylacetate-CoA ligase